MASSFQMALRGGIMIVTMIAIPLLAIFGKQLPEFIEAIYRGNTAADRWETRPAQTAGAPASKIGANQLAVQQQRVDLAPAPAFQPGAAGSTNVVNVNAPRGHELNHAVLNHAQPKIAEPPPLATNAFQAAQPLALNPSSNPSINNARSNNLSQALPPTTLRDQQVSPAALSRAAPELADLTSAAFKSGQQRLRELGASYFKLETTGEATERYRAVCQIAATTGSPVQEFKSIHTEPLMALNDVIAQVERARGGRMELQAQRGTMLR